MIDISRRSLLSASLAGLGAALLGSCGTGGQEPVPTLGAPTSGCVSLDTHTFRRGAKCTNASASGADLDVAPIDHRGPLVLGEGTAATAYIDAVVEWELATGQARRLLAPRLSDSWCFAHRGAWTVVPRCDGALVVYRDGCWVADLVGHSPAQSSDGTPGPVRSLCWSDDEHLVSLGTDATLRLWNVPRANQEAVDTLDWEATAMSPGTDGSILISGADRVEVRSPALEPLSQFTPPLATSWTVLGADTLAGVGSDGRDVVVWDTASGIHELVDTPTLAALGCLGGRMAVISGLNLIMRSADGTLTRTQLEDSSYHPDAVALSPDGTTVHLVDQLEGLRTIDVATGATLITFTDPAPQ